MELVSSTVRNQTQKSNTESTTESEGVAVSEYVPYKIHMINIFLGGKAMLYNKRFLLLQQKFN